METLVKNSIYSGDCLQLQRVSSLSNVSETGRRQAGWQGAGEVAKNYILIQRREKYSETLGLGWAFESLKAYSW